jgi:hypothetical protein
MVETKDFMTAEGAWANSKRAYYAIEMIKARKANGCLQTKSNFARLPIEVLDRVLDCVFASHMVEMKEK